jgi:hypothetical protein
MANNLFWEKGNISPANFEPGRTESVNQVGHGFILPLHGFIPVYDNSGTWAAADGSSSSSYHDAVIVEVTDTDNFVIQRNGYLNVDDHGLQPFTDYYLSETLAGTITIIAPASARKVATPVTDDWLYVHNYSNARAINGLEIDSATGQIVMGGLLDRDTVIDGFSGGLFDFDIGADNIAFDTINGAQLSSLFGDVDILAGGQLDLYAESLARLESAGDVRINSNGISSGDIQIQNIGTGDVRISADQGELIIGASFAINISTPGLLSASVGDVLTLLDTATGECEWQPASGGDEKEDDVFRIIDDVDNTKKIAFQASGISTGTTRTITMPDADVDLGLLSSVGNMAGATFYDSTGGQIISNSRTVINLDATLTNNATGVFSLASDEITVAEDGFYIVGYTIAADLNSGTRENYYGYLQHDAGSGFADVSGSFIAGYSRIDTESTSASAMVVIELSASDKLRISAISTRANGHDTVVGSKLSIVQLKGIKGDTGATGPAGGNEKEDNVFRIIDDGDNTKKIAFQASGISTGTTRTITMPDADVDLGKLGSPICATFYNTSTTASSGVVTIDTTLTNNAPSIFSLSSNEVTIDEDGFYLVSYSFGGTYSSTFLYTNYIELDTGSGFSEIFGSRKTSPGMQTLGGYFYSHSSAVTHEFSSGDKIRIYDSGGGLVSPLQYGCNISITKL